MSYYQYHMFFCLNDRSGGQNCCAMQKARELFDYAKKICKDLNFNGPGKMRVNQSGCMNRCKHAPVIVVYPHGHWYTVNNQTDVNKIICNYIYKKNDVKHLLICE